MGCCPRCFVDRWLKEHIRSNSTENGDCDYCNARDVPLIPIAKLAPRFEAMMSLYHELNADTILPLEDPLKVGNPLLTLVQEDWDVFSERLIEAGMADTLLEELANFNWDDDSGEPQFSTTDLYTHRVSWSHDTLEDILENVIHQLGEDPDNPEIPCSGKALSSTGDE